MDALCKRFNIDLSRRTKHNALLDCELLREVYIRLLDVKEPKLIFSNENSSTGNDVKNKFQKHCKIVLKPNQQEIKSHEQFIKKELKKNFY